MNKRPDILKIGLVYNRTKDRLPLSFIVPATDKKMNDMMVKWVNKNSYQLNHVITSANDPAYGFRILTPIERDRSIWRVEDPRGFEAEIDFSNLRELIGHTTIENGIILNKLIWTFSSSIYAKAILTVA